MPWILLSTTSLDVVVAMDGGSLLPMETREFQGILQTVRTKANGRVVARQTELSITRIHGWRFSSSDGDQGILGILTKTIKPLKQNGGGK
jgi:hypothetical protein